MTFESRADTRMSLQGQPPRTSDWCRRPEWCRRPAPPVGALVDPSRRRLCGLMLLASLVACGEESRRDAPTGTQPPASGPGSNVLLVTFDTTRADRVGCYGGDPAVTPHLDALAAGGVRFAQAQATAPLTLPSHASILTGRYPTTHGVRDNGFDRLGPAPPVLAELLRAEGFATAAFVSSFVLEERFGLARGFDTYDDELPGRRAGQGGEGLERDAEQTVARAEGWLRRTAPGRRFFAWVHFYDPHTPYRAPSPWAERLPGRPYEAEIARADDALGRLLAALRESGVAERTLVVVAADHGEAFGEHGERGHGVFVYQVTLHVPLVIAWPGTIPAGTVVPSPVSLVDVMPTVLAACRLPMPDGLDGRSLLDLCHGAEAPAGTGRILYAESLHGQRRYGWSALHSVRTARWQFIRAPRPELYDLVDDPAEERDVLALQPAVASDLAARLTDLEGGRILAAAPAVEPPVDDAALRALQQLGYAGGESLAGPEDAGADPKDRVASIVSYQRAKELLEAGRPGEALPLLEDLARESPDSSELLAKLGLAHARLGHWPAAEASLGRALDLDPRNVSALVNLAGVFLSLDQPAPARSLLEQALRFDPDEALAHLNLGAVEERLGHPASARRHLERFLELVPDDERVPAVRAAVARLDAGPPTR